jgi:heme/copper-type cytochrome/quinol oxidase subunit 4
MNKYIKILFKLCYILGIIFVFIGISILAYTTYNKQLGLISITLGAFLSFIYHISMYKMKKENNIKNNYINIIIIVIGILLAIVFARILF